MINKTAAHDLIKGVSEMLDIYSYEDYALQSHNPQLPLTVDLRSGLKRLNDSIDRQKSFPDFTRSVTNLLNSLYDGHTVLSADCSGRISYDAFLPLAYYKVNGTTEARVYVHPEYDQFLVDRKINETSQFDLQRSLAGAEVLEVDGIPIRRYLDGLLSDHNIIYGNIDPQTRWNQLFVNLRGHPTPRLGYGVAFTSLSRAWINADDFSITVRYQNGTSRGATLPWLGIVDSDYHKVKDVIAFQDYYSEYVCMAGNSTELLRRANMTMAESPPVVRSRTIDRAHRQQYLFDQEYSLVRSAPSPLSRTAMTSRDRDLYFSRALPSSKTAVPGAASQLKLLSSVNSGFQIYHFHNTTVGVLYYTNFSGDEELESDRTNSTSSYYHRYVKEMTRGLKELHALGVDTLLIDVSGNNGGATELGSFAMLSLFPLQYPGFGTVLRSNAEMLSFLDGSDEQIGFSRADGSTFNSVQDWLSRDNKTLVVNNLNASYSQLTVDNLIDNSSWHLVGNATFPVENLFSPERMMIISNGKCASTCAQVTMYFQDVHGIKSVGFGGKPGRTHQLQTVGGVRGAQVVEMLDEDPAANMYNFTMKVSQMTINFRTAIHYQNRVPTEYVTRNVDFAYEHTEDTYKSFEKTWAFVAEKHFSRAMSTPPERAAKIDWKPLTKYPAGWFDALLALQSSLDQPEETNFPRMLE